MIRTDSIISNHILAGTIVASDIASGTITATQIAASTITADRMNVSTLSAIQANMGSITTGNINLNSGAFTLASNGDLAAVNIDGTNGDFSTSVLTAAATVTFDLTVNGSIFIGSSGTLDVADLAGTGNRAVCADSGGALVIC
jgi:hypothetical protein